MLCLLPTYPRLPLQRWAGVGGGPAGTNEGQRPLQLSQSERSLETGPALPSPVTLLEHSLKSARLQSLGLRPAPERTEL